MKKILLTVFIFISIFSLSDTICLKNGDEFTGELLSYNGMDFIFKTKYTTMTIAELDVKYFNLSGDKHAEKGVLFSDGQNFKEAKLNYFSNDSYIFDFNGGKIVLNAKDSIVSFATDYDDMLITESSTQTLLLDNNMELRGNIISIKNDIVIFNSENYGTLN